MKHFISLLLVISSVSACGNNSNKPEDTMAHSGHKSGTESNNYCDSVNNGLIGTDTLKGSPHRTAMATINGTHVHIEYSSPGVKNRVVWGGLVGYGNVWVTGAHKATTVQFSKPVEIGNKQLPAGIYALFTIPGKESWIVIFNSRYEQHLADEYAAAEDLVRLTLVPENHAMTQRLTYTVAELNGPTGLISMRWEKLQLNIPFKTIQ